MLLATSIAGRAACLMCGWKQDLPTAADTEAELREHLRAWHARVLVVKDERRAKNGAATCRYCGPRFGRELEGTVVVNNDHVAAPIIAPAVRGAGPC